MTLRSGSLYYAELLVFGIFFLAYAFARASTSNCSTSTSRRLTGKVAPSIPLVLITSSYFVVMAVNAIRRNAAMLCSQWLVLAVLQWWCVCIL